MSKLYLMMRSSADLGKSTWIKKQLKNTDAYVSRDEIRFNLLKDNEDYFKYESEVFNIFCNRINEALNNPNIYKVFADATHLNAKSRIKVLDKLNIKPNEINVIWLKTPLDVCLKRNKQRIGRANVPEDTIKNMYYNLEEPSNKENIDYLYIVDYKSKTIKSMWLKEFDFDGFIF